MFLVLGSGEEVEVGSGAEALAIAKDGQAIKKKSFSEVVDRLIP